MSLSDPGKRLHRVRIKEIEDRITIVNREIEELKVKREPLTTRIQTLQSEKDSLQLEKTSLQNDING